MAYAPPELSTLRSSCLRGLRDDGTTFVEATLDDMINEAVAELDRFLPVERQVEIVSDDIARVIPVDLSYVWAVERVITETRTVDAITYTTVVAATIPVNNPAVPGWRTGWDLYAGNLDLGPLWGDGLLAMIRQYTGHAEFVLTLRVSGYGPRERLVEATDILDVSSMQEEFALRKYVALIGFRALEHDRSLYQQWITQTNNTDVSPTQLMSMRGQTEAEWERLQKQLKRVRRPAMG